MLLDKAAKNPALAQALSMLPYFPIFADFPATPPPPPMPPPEAVEPSGPLVGEAPKQ
jgi:hypothetical protein